MINSTPTTSNDTTTTIRYKGPCGRRVACWRPECRQAFGAYPSIEILADKAIAFCHRLAVPLDDPRLRAAS